MRIINDENGFTLIETLIAILIMVTAVASIISFYLFANKFIKAASINLEERQKINQFVFNVSEMIYKSSEFNILINQSLVLIQLEDGKKINFSDKDISIQNYYELNDIEGCRFFIDLEDGENVIYDSKKNDINGIKNIPIEQISSMNIEIAYKSRKYKILYNKPPISILKFINIE